MQQLGNFDTANQSQAPVFVVVLFDSATRLPSFALIQESPTDIPSVYLNGVAIETRGLLGDLSITVARPSDGGGILRRNCTLNINTEHASGYAYFRAALSKSLYYGGQTVGDFYFGIYGFERHHMNEDLRDGLFYGFYQIESGVQWTEEDGTTQLPLNDILNLDETIVGATSESIPESFFLYNPWFDGVIVPKVFGYVPRIKLINSFPSISVKDLSASISGSVAASYNGASTSIILEQYTDKSSVLRQIADIGGYVRIKMADGEVIYGTLDYDDVANTVTLLVVTRNTYYGKSTGYTYASNGQTPADWRSDATYQRIPPTWSYNSSVILDGKNKIQDTSGWMQADVEFWVDPTTIITETRAVQMQGWDNEDENLLKHDTFFNAANDNTSVLSYDFFLAGYGAGYIPGFGSQTVWANPAGQYLKFLAVPKEVKFYFNDPNTSVPGSGAAGSGWQMVGIEPAAVTYECYIRNGYSHFSNNNVYCEGDGRLIKIPTANIVSVTDSTTVGALTSMAKIVLTAAPLDMDIGATSNVVYTDALYRTGTNEKRTEKVINAILAESSFLSYFAGNNITDTSSGLSASNWLPYIGYLAKGEETVTDVVDRACFQCGATFRWSRNQFHIRQTAYVTGAETTVDIDGDDYIKPELPTTDMYEMLENASSINFGKLRTAIDAAGYEYIPLYFEVDYGGWEDPFFKPAKQLVNKAIRPKERKVSYAFDLINDPASMNYAVGAFLSIGHPSAVSSVQRTLVTEMSLHGCQWEALDPVVFKDFPLISTADETNANLDTSRYPRYLKPLDGKKFIMGAVCVAETVEYNLAVRNPNVKLTARMSQTFVNANGVSIYAPPYPPLPPPVPSGNPADPPSAPTGGAGSGYGYGGTYDPMPLALTGVATIEIDSLAAEVLALSVAVNSSGIYTGGWTYALEVVDPYATGAASVSVAAGSFLDKLDDSYVNTPIPFNLTVDYTWFTPVPAALTRTLILRFTRTIKYSIAGPDTYTDVIDYPITVNIARPLDIVGS
jgi:hypothetical protein